MITWSEKIAFVGITAKVMPSDYHRFEIKLSYDPGLCSFGGGDTIEEAIEHAAISMPIDWLSVTKKITELAWQQMSHT